MADAPTGRNRPSRHRGAARLAAVQALYQTAITGIDGEQVVAEFLHHRLAQPAGEDALGLVDEALFSDLVTGTLNRTAALDPLIAGALTPEWPLERLEIILRQILRAAVYELTVRHEIPVRVIIAQYVDVAHAFFSGKEPGLVNGVLDRLGRELRAAEWARDAG